MESKLKREILINSNPFETRIAVLENGKVVELFIESRDTEKIAGNIYKGRVSNINVGTQVAFVDIGLNKDAFLNLENVDIVEYDEHEGSLSKYIYKSPIQDLLKVGQEVLVQILKEPTSNKGPLSTMNLSFPGRYVVLMPFIDHIGVSKKITNEKERERLKLIGRRILPGKMGIIFRTAAEGIDEKEIKEDLSLLLRLWNKVEQRSKRLPSPSIVYKDLSLTFKVIRDLLDDTVDKILIDNKEELHDILETCDFLSPLQRASFELYEETVPIFEKFGIETEIQQALASKVWLDNGAYIIFEKTEAMVTVDVNSGRFGKGSGIEDTIFQVNLEAAKEIARQIRLRNLSGIIVIDFIDMQDPKNKQKVLKTLIEGFKGDRNKPYVYDFSELGLVQMTRKRTSASLEELLMQTCPACKGRGKILSMQAVANYIRRGLLDEVQRYDCRTFLVKANKKVVEYFDEDNSKRIFELERMTKRRIVFKSCPELEIDQWQIVPQLYDYK